MGVVLSGCDNRDIEPMNVSMQAVPVTVMDMSTALCITTRAKVVIPQMAVSSRWQLAKRMSGLTCIVNETFAITQGGAKYLVTVTVHTLLEVCTANRISHDEEQLRSARAYRSTT